MTVPKWAESTSACVDFGCRKGFILIGRKVVGDIARDARGVKSLLDAHVAVTAPGERGSSGLGKAVIIDVPGSGTACYNLIDRRDASLCPTSLGNLALKIISQPFFCGCKTGEIADGKSVKARHVKRLRLGSG